MTKHFVKCLAGVTLVHVIAAAVVLVAYSFARSANTELATGQDPPPAASRDYHIMHVDKRDPPPPSLVDYRLLATGSPTG